MRRRTGRHRKPRWEWPPLPAQNRTQLLGKRLLERWHALRALEPAFCRAEATLIAALRHHNTYQQLGFVRFFDFAVEALGTPARTARRRVRLADLLERIPAMETTLLQGRISPSTLDLLAPVLTAQNSEAWTHLASVLPVRELRKEVATAMARGEADATSSDGSSPDCSPPDGLPADCASADSPPERTRIAMSCPQVIGFAIESGLETARRVLGYNAPKDECLQSILAEAESELGPSGDAEPGAEAAGSVSPPATTHDPVDFAPAGRLRAAAFLPRTRSSGRRRHPRTQPEHWPEGKRPRRPPREDWSVLGYPSQRHRRGKRAVRLAGKRLAQTVGRLHEIDGRIRATALDRHRSTHDPTSNVGHHVPPADLLRWFHELQRTRRRVQALQGRLMAYFFGIQAGYALGLGPFDRVARVAFGLSPSTCDDHLVLGLSLFGSPLLTDYYLSGRITASHLRALTNVGRQTQKEWIRRAAGVTVRQLRRELAFVVRCDRYDIELLLLGDVPGSGAWTRAENMLRGRLLRFGWTPRTLEKRLEDDDLGADDGENDPAQNPSRMRRLELLLDLVILESCERLTENEPLASDRRTLAAPGKHVRIVIWARESIHSEWSRACARLRTRCGGIPDWAATTILTQAAVSEWERHDPDRLPTEHRILERDQYQCQVPGCSSRRNLEVHHIIFRSQGGPDRPWNLITLCHAHHHHAVHRGTLRIRGQAPYRLTFTFAPGTPCQRVYHGDRLGRVPTVLRGPSANQTPPLVTHFTSDCRTALSGPRARDFMR